MRKILLIGGSLLVVVALIVAGVTQLQGQSQPNYSANVIAALSDTTNINGFTRATDVRTFKFPQDYGAHPDFQTEWWYYTGNLADTSGRRFGFEFTIFRRALTPTPIQRVSDWGASQIYFADLALTDVQGNKFYSTERFSRGAAGLSGAVIDPQLRIWIENWAMTAQNSDATTIHLQADNTLTASSNSAEPPIALDLVTQQTKPPALEGDRGLSAKGSESGNASYYYSLTHLETQGTLTVGTQIYTVSGLSWMDHEFSTSALSKDVIGWDWFSLQLSDNREIMLYHLRRNDGSADPVSDGTLVMADGSTQRLTLSDFTIEPLATWHSMITNSDYPSKWRVTVRPAIGQPIVITVTPLLADQELHSTTTYWEGASQIAGTQGDQALTGYGYVELTGYTAAVSSGATATPNANNPTPGVLQQPPH